MCLASLLRAFLKVTNGATTLVGSDDSCTERNPNRSLYLKVPLALLLPCHSPLWRECAGWRGVRTCHEGKRGEAMREEQSGKHVLSKPPKNEAWFGVGKSYVQRSTPHTIHKNGKAKCKNC